MYKWLAQVGECLRFTDPVMIWIGFSLIVKDEHNNLVYIYAIRQLSSYQFKFNKREQFDYFSKTYFDKIPLDELLNATYISTRDDNPFYKSGFRPVRLVCNYIWIRK